MPHSPRAAPGTSGPGPTGPRPTARSNATSARAREWAYQRAWSSNDERAPALPAFLDRYNYARPHTAVKGRPQPVVSPPVSPTSRHRTPIFAVGAIELGNVTDWVLGAGLGVLVLGVFLAWAHVLAGLKGYVTNLPNPPRITICTGYFETALTGPDDQRGSRVELAPPGVGQSLSR